MFDYRVSAERIGLAAKARLSNDLYPKFDLDGQRLRAAYAHSYLQKGLHEQGNRKVV
jgi:hypothetical protein